MRFGPASLVATIILSFGPAAARANLLINGSLESAIPPKQPDNLVYITPSTHAHALTGWTINSGAIDVVPSSYFQSTDGNFSVDMAGTPGLGNISQVVATVADQTYTMTFDFAINPEHGRIDEHLTTKRLRIEAVNSKGKVIATEDYTGTAGQLTLQDLGYVAKSFSFTADGTTTKIRIKALAPLNLPPHLVSSRVYTGPVIDNLDLEVGSGGVIPEPASLSLMGVGAISLLLRRRRRA